MKKLADFLSEKLVINKNFKNVSSNDTNIALSIIKKYIDLNQTRVYTKKDISRVGKFSKNVLNDIDNLLGSSLDLTDYKKLVNICNQFDELDTLYRLHGYDIVDNGVSDVVIKISEKIKDNGKNVWANNDDIRNKGVNIFRTDDLIIIISLKSSAGWVYIGFNQKDLDDVEPFKENVDEKLVIIPSQVNEKLVIIPSQVNEKLVINKNFKVIGNDEFYETFKESISDLIECRFFTYYRHFKDIKNIPLTKRVHNEINDIFEKAKSSSGEIMHCLATTSNSMKIYNDMIEYIDEHQNELEITYDKTYSGFTGFEFIVKVIETSEILCALIGPKKVSPISSYGDIIVTYK